MTLLGTEDTVLSTYIAAHKLDTILAAPGVAGAAAAAGDKDPVPCEQCTPLVAALETQLRTAAELGQVLLARHSAQAAAAQHATRRHADAETALKEMELARERAEYDRDTAERAQKTALGRVHRLEREMELMVAQYERLERTTETINDTSNCTDFTRTVSPASIPQAASTKLVDSLVRDNSNLQATIIDLREQLLAARDEINALRAECDAISQSKEVHHHHHHIHINGNGSSQLPAGVLPEGSQFHLNKPRQLLRKFVSQESGLNTTTTIFEQDESQALPKQLTIDASDPALSLAIDEDSDEDDIPYSPFPVLKRSTSHDSIFSALTTHDSDMTMPAQSAYPGSMYKLLARPALTNRRTSTATVSTADREVSAELTRSTGLNRQKSRMILHQHHYNTTNCSSSSSSSSSKSKVEPSPKRSTSMGSMWSAMLFGNKTSAPAALKPDSKAAPPSAPADMLTPPTVAGLRRATLPIASPIVIYPQTTFSSPSASAALAHSFSSKSRQKR
ncbi:hypothetical protein D0Z00_002905 [Geotrichum galactomycetum]|uniref:Uncharacterized protein n=1 Tax=Geotrichum galactomycetum TaxID=27317 RepID=A0ACB6V2T5_9ASCO|nr:hypothetical protein D0Z00_002905 [Geotrichum candidum]